MIINDIPLNPAALEAAAKALDSNFNPDQYPIMAAMFKDYAETAVSAYLAAAQPVVNSVEVIPAQVQVVSWDEEPEHEQWKITPEETFVGLILKSGRSWSPSDQYTLHVERKRPEVGS